MRNFRLVNKDGKEYRLLTRQMFLHSPSGLGYKENTTYQQLGNQFAVVDAGFGQANPKGYIFFPQPNAYQKYHDFVQFCQDTPLRLFYKPKTTEYVMDVRLDEITKTEIDVTTGLNCSVSFLGQTMWYKEVRDINTGGATDGKIYEYTYDYQYEGNIPNTVSFDSDSFYDSPMRLTIFGECDNPQWQHYVDGELVATGGVTGHIGDGMRLVVDATTIPYSIREINGLGETVLDMYQFSDFNTARFLKAQHGKNRVVISHEGLDALGVVVEARISYASV